MFYIYCTANITPIHQVTFCRRKQTCNEYIICKKETTKYDENPMKTWSCLNHAEIMLELCPTQAQNIPKIYSLESGSNHALVMLNTCPKHSKNDSWAGPHAGQAADGASINSHQPSLCGIEWSKGGWRSSCLEFRSAQRLPRRGEGEVATIRRQKPSNEHERQGDMTEPSSDTTTKATVGTTLAKQAGATSMGEQRNI